MSTTVSTDTFKSLLADKVRDTSKICVYGLKFPTDWHELYLIRMNIIALDRNNDYITSSGESVLTATEIQGMTSFLNKHL
jgi:hypothetical protein